MCLRASLMLIKSVFHCFPRDIVTWAPSTLRWRTNPNPESLVLVAALAAPWSLTCGLQFLSSDPFRILQNPSESFRPFVFFLVFYSIWMRFILCFWSSECPAWCGVAAQSLIQGCLAEGPPNQADPQPEPSTMSLPAFPDSAPWWWPWLVWIDAEIFLGAERTSITSIWSLFDHYLILVDFDDCMRTMRNTHSNNNRFQLCSLM